jgi:hypothetical protein
MTRIIRIFTEIEFKKSAKILIIRVIRVLKKINQKNHVSPKNHSAQHAPREILFRYQHYPLHLQQKRKYPK